VEKGTLLNQKIFSKNNICISLCEWKASISL
jgi:hypothetical protein